ncbi:NF038122 family metalloprotease [Sandaracinobacter neustonicus]|uniref:NF038122 family metalloprotease n=1 Tax=Sandaracinobacter neustonicus TaxID=1715348 RepID=UPI001A9C3E83|nr:NF038122 family metalloprotease [Sandaracinobacter neustonicus]
MIRVRKTMMLAGFAAVAMSAVPANALSIVLTNMGGVEEGTDAWIGFTAAAKYWESVLTNDVTVNIRVGFSDLGATTLGSASSSGATYTTAAYKTALAASATSDLDDSVVANLDNLTSNNYRVYTALGKALGLYTNTTNNDSTIRFNNTFAWDFNTNDGFTGYSSDFISVAVHEIGHALGWASGVTQSGNGQAANTDLLRYQNGSWSMAWGGDPYLSIDGGETQIFDRSWMSTGADGRQTSHWKDGARIHDGVTCTQLLEPQIGIMDPTGGICQQGIVTAADLAVMDAIGWTLAWDILTTPTYTFNSAQILNAAFPQFGAVPEASTWAMLIAGFGLVGLAARRRRETATA